MKQVTILSKEMELGNEYDVYNWNLLGYDEYNYQITKIETQFMEQYMGSHSKVIKGYDKEIEYVLNDIQQEWDEYVFVKISIYEYLRVTYKNKHIFFALREGALQVIRCTNF